MELKGTGSISFENDDYLLGYIDKIITENVSSEVLVKRVRSPAKLLFCVRSMNKQKKEQSNKTKREGFRQSAELQARIYSENANSPAVSDSTKLFILQSPENAYIAISTCSNNCSFT